MHHKFASQLVELKKISQLNQMHWSDKWDLNQNRSKDAAITVIYYASDASVSKFHYNAIALNIWLKSNQPKVFACKMYSLRPKPQTNFLIKLLNIAKCECKMKWIHERKQFQQKLSTTFWVGKKFHLILESLVSFDFAFISSVLKY